MIIVSHEQSDSKIGPVPLPGGCYRDERFRHWYPPDGPLTEAYIPWRPMRIDPYFTRLASDQRRQDAPDRLVDVADELLTMLDAWREVRR
jgi:hypothetical protein